MAFKTPDIPRPDHTSVGVGDQGDPVSQEPDSGKQIQRKGAGSEEADIDIATSSSPHDLIDDGDFESGQRSTGGAAELAGEIVSDDNNSFSVFVDWLDDDGNVLITHNPDALTDVPDRVDFDMIVRSDHFEVRVTDTSGGSQNNIHGTVNSH